jgi:hypothetical protein
MVKRTPTAAELAEAVERVVAERNRLLELLSQVDGAVLDKAPGGMSIAYLPADLLAEIREKRDGR